jgi:hypothetical protein
MRLNIVGWSSAFEAQRCGARCPCGRDARVDEHSAGSWLYPHRRYARRHRPLHRAAAARCLCSLRLLAPSGCDSATAAIFSSSLSHMATPASEKYMVLVGMVALLTAGFLLLARFFKLGFLADFLSRTRSPPSWAALFHVVSFDRAGVEVSTRRKARWVSGLDKTTARDHDPAAATPFDRFHRAGTGDDRSRRDFDRATWTLDESDPVVNITNHPVRD